MVAKIPKQRHDKHPDPLHEIRNYLKYDRVFETGHALQRLQQREVTHFEYKYVLSHGQREKSRDRYDEKFEEWTYSMKGKTLENRTLRVIVSFNIKLNVITVIDLDLEL